MSLLKKLQVYTHQVSHALEESSQKVLFKKVWPYLFSLFFINLQVLQNLPRVVRDAELLNQEALLLKDKMHSVKEEIAKVKKQNVKSR